MTNADFGGVNFQGVDLEGADLTDASPENADLAGVNLAGAYLTRADLAGASLKGATLAGAVFYQVDFTGADLTGVDLENTYCDWITKFPADSGWTLRGRRHRTGIKRPCNGTQIRDGSESRAPRRGFPLSGQSLRKVLLPAGINA